MRSAWGVAAFLVLAGQASGQLTQVAQFPTGASSVGLGFDWENDVVVTYPSFGAVLKRYSGVGSPMSDLARPGGSANDADVDIAKGAFMLGGSPVPAGTVLYIDGESGVAEVYAVSSSGTVIASLVTAFGTSHVVGGAFHPGRGTLFLLQDKVPGGTGTNRVAEIDPATGGVLQTWQVTASRPTFTVNFGDLDVGGNGNVFIVSSDEETVGEFTPTGAFVAEHALPSGVTSLCGIGFDATRCEAWVLNTSGVASKLAGFPSTVCPPPCDPDVNQDGNVDQDDVTYLINVVGGGANPTGIDPDFNQDGNVDQDDVSALINTVGGGGCP
ncbi:MAG: dockerin type I domain-containing protein [Phycisphaerales bacterium]